MFALRRFLRSWLRNNCLRRIVRTVVAFALRSAKLHPEARFDIDGRICLAQGVTIREHCRIRVVLGGRLALEAGVWLARGVLIEAKSVRIGANTTVQEGTRIFGEVCIGEQCIIAPNIFLSSGSHHFSVIPAMPIRDQDRLIWNDAGHANKRSRPIELHDDCWLGINAVIMPGVTVGRGAVIGANAVVTADVPPYSVVAGAPARPVGQRLRFDPPSTLNAINPAHLPYFYQGFPLSIEGAKLHVQRFGGLEATGRFTLALRLGNGYSPSRMRFCAWPSDGQEVLLRFGQQEIMLTHNAVSLDFTVFRDSGPLYEFEILTGKNEPARIILKEAHLIPDETHDK